MTRSTEGAKYQWQPIETCPFAPYLEVWMTDGENVRLVEVDRRLGHGTPVSWFEDVGGEWKISTRIPKWQVEWRLADLEAPENFCSSGPLPRDEIDFMPTHWMPRQEKPAAP
jgi:hypothetical protein